MINVEQQLDSWQQLIGTTPNLKEEFEKIKTELIKSNDKNPEGRALQRIHSKFKNLTRSKAPAFTGVVIAKSEPVDYNAYKWTKARKMFDEDPILAQSGEYSEKDGHLLFKTNDKGQPLDVQERWPSGDANKNYLKPIAAHAWSRYIDGVAALTKPDPSNPTKADIATRFILTVKDEFANPSSPTYFDPSENISIEFRALDKTKKEEDILKLSGAVVTRWAPSKVPMPTPETIIEKYYSDVITPAHMIGDTFEKRGKALVIVDGFVASMNREENSKTGNRMMNISTMEMDESVGQKMIACWIPKHVKMDFGEESEVRVIGMMDRRPVYEDGKPTGEFGEVNINVRAIIVLNKVDAPVAVKDYDPSQFKDQSGNAPLPNEFMG